MENKIEKIIELLNDDPNVPSYERAKNMIRERWGEDFTKIAPSHILQIGEKLKIYRHINGEIVPSQNFVKHNFENRRHLIGAYGLIILHHYDVIRNILKNGSFVLAVDSQEFLPKGNFFNAVIPVLEKTEEGEYRYYSLPYAMHLENTEYFLVSED